MSAIEAVQLGKRYGEVTAVDRVDLVVEPGEIVGLLGRNGAGKSTTVEMIAGLRRPDAGQVRVLGLDPIRERRRVRQVLGVQLQDAQLHDSLTVRELAHLYRTFYRRGAAPDDLVEAVGLHGSRDTRFDRLSGGQQQRLSVLVALLGDPQVVILDELTTGLDPDGRRQMWALVEGLRERGVAVLLVSHLMEEVERLCQRVTILDAGAVVASDTPLRLFDLAGLRPRVRFHALDPLPDDTFNAVPGIEGVEVAGSNVVVSGSGDLLTAVSAELARVGVAATETRLERPTLDDAFLALTGRELAAEGATS